MAPCCVRDCPNEAGPRHRHCRPHRRFERAVRTQPSCVCDETFDTGDGRAFEVVGWAIASNRWATCHSCLICGGVRGLDSSGILHVRNEPTMLLPTAKEAHKARRVEGFHPNVQCDKSKLVPIVGTRFTLKGQNYDLCAREFHRLSAAEKIKYDAVKPTEFRPVPLDT